MCSLRGDHKDVQEVLDFRMSIKIARKFNIMTSRTFTRMKSHVFREKNPLSGSSGHYSVCRIDSDNGFSHNK